jgi:hypothetical protein
MVRVDNMSDKIKIHDCMKCWNFTKYVIVTI